MQCYEFGSVPHFPAFWSAFPRIRTEYGDLLVNLRIQSECREKRTRKTPNTDTFYAMKIDVTEVYLLQMLSLEQIFILSFKKPKMENFFSSIIDQKNLPLL